MVGWRGVSPRLACLSLAILTLPFPSGAASPASPELAPGAVGDTAAYAYAVVDHSGYPVAAPSAFLQFSWGAPGPTRDAQGREWRAQRLHWESPSLGGTSTWSIVEGRILAETRHARDQGIHALDPLALLPLRQDERTDLTITRFVDMPSELDGLEGLLQCFALAAGPWPSMPCVPGLAPAGTARLGGRTVDRWVSPDGVRLWLAPDLPYPVRILMPGPEDLAEVATLTGWTAGTGPLAAGSVEGDDPPPLEWRAPRRWGLDDSDTHHPWRLSSAYISAAEPLTAHNIARPPVIDQFREAHPDAFAESAEYSTLADGPARTHAWTFRLAGDGERLTIRSTFQRSQEDIPTKAGMLGAVSWTEGDDMPDASPPPTQGVAAMPTIASLAAHWEAFAATYNAPPEVGTWGFRLHCPDPCDETRGAFWIGMLEPLSAAGPVLRRNALLLVDEEGRHVAFVESALRSELRIDAPAQRPASASEPVEPATIAFEFADVGDWRPAAGIALAILAAGAAAWALFTRLRAPQLLDQETRRAIFDAIQASPGLYREEILQRLGLPRGTVEHHLHKLEQGQLVVAHRGPRYVCYFPRQGTDRRLAAAVPLLKAEGARVVLQALAASPASLRETARGLGLTHQTVSYHARRLAAAGLVERATDGHYATTTFGADVLRSDAAA